jgi:hypothetical protein
MPKKSNPYAKKDPLQKIQNPLSVKLTGGEVAKLTTVAVDLGVSRHELLRYAIRQFLAGWERGERPRVVSRGVKLEP